MTFTLRRPAARAVLLDREARIFLIEAEDPIDPRKPDWLEIPGGGMGWNEDSGAAALRELHEETGIPNVDMGPCVWVQQTEYDFAGYHFESDDRIHVAWCDGGEYDPKGLEALEAAAFMGARWWTLDELMASDMPTVPYLLREHLPALIAGDLPAEPIDITPPPSTAAVARAADCVSAQSGLRCGARRPCQARSDTCSTTSSRLRPLPPSDQCRALASARPTMPKARARRPAGSMPSMSISSAMASAIDRSNPRTSTANSSSERTPSP